MPLFWPAAILAGGSVLGAGIGAASAGSAASATAQSAQQSLNEQRREFNQTQSNLQPWLQTGTGALSQLAALYGIQPMSPSTYSTANGGTPETPPGLQAVQDILQSGGVHTPGANASPIQDIAGALGAGKTVTDAQWAQAGYGPGGSAPGSSGASGTANPTLAQANPTIAPIQTGQPSGTPGQPNYAIFYQSPDYQFRLQQGIAGTDAGAAARGSLDSGATRKAEIGYAGNLAAGDYNNYANRLAALAGIGQTTANNLGTLGANYASNVGNTLVNQGNNLASSYLAQGNAYSGAVGNLASIGSGLIQNYAQPYSAASGGQYAGSYLAPFNSAAAAQGF